MNLLPRATSSVFQHKLQARRGLPTNVRLEINHEYLGPITMGGFKIFLG